MIEGNARGLTEIQRYFFDLYGYVVIEDVLDAAEVAHLNQVFDEHRDELPVPNSTDIASQRLGPGFLAWDPLFRDLIDHPLVIGALSQFMPRTGPRLDHAYGILIDPGTSLPGAPHLHGGGFPSEAAFAYRQLGGGEVRMALTVASWALNDAPRGGFCCIPGSHKASFSTPAEVAADYERFPELIKPIPMKAGSVLLFTEALAHGTTTWPEDYQRRSILMKYTDGFMTYSDPPDWSQVLAGVPIDESKRRVLAGPNALLERGTRKF